jgi:hypothetical protein
MNYESMSDFEINLEVARWIGVVINDNQDAALKSKPSSVLCNDIISSLEYNFCNNHADMWPIIFASNISIINIKNTTQWFACSDVEFENICMSPDGNDSGISSMYAKNECYCTNPLRAAAIVFLMMQEAK